MNITIVSMEGFSSVSPEEAEKLEETLSKCDPVGPNTLRELIGMVHENTH